MIDITYHKTKLQYVECDTDMNNNNTIIYVNQTNIHIVDDIIQQHISYTQYLSPYNISKIIFQTWKTYINQSITPILYNTVKSWSTYNNHYLHLIYTDDAIEQYIRKHMLYNQQNDRLYNYITTIQECYNKLQLIVQKIDLWRLLIIYEYGGLYVDIDVYCNKPIIEWNILSNATMISGTGQRHDIHQWLLMYSAKHDLIYNTIINVLHNIQKYDIQYINSNVEAVTGPIVLQQTYQTMLSDQQYNTLFSTSYTWSTDYMNNNVLFKADNITCELESQLQYQHWITIQDNYRLHNNIIYYSIICILILFYIIIVKVTKLL